MHSNTPRWSYDRHAEHETVSDLPSCYTAPDSVDAWRHNRMLSSIVSLIRTFPASTWMTIGDGRYGSDAFFLQEHGADVVATSLTDTTLKIAHQRGYIKKYQTENAEHISAIDNSFDFILCKASYHHFPRPPVAYYEMLRVAKQAVILIEPLEDKERLFDSIKTIAKKLIRGDTVFLFERSGNFIYRTNVREIEKMLTALNGSCVAVKKFNDFYYSKAGGYRNQRFSFGTIITKVGIFIQDLFCRLGLMNYGLGVIIAFKNQVPLEMEQELNRSGFHIISLPKNPYL